jgi:hypothetical protein
VSATNTTAVALHDRGIGPGGPDDRHGLVGLDRDVGQRRGRDAVAAELRERQFALPARSVANRSHRRTR